MSFGIRKTKIVCTIGPASADKETIKQMCLKGMNVARLNFSHNTHADHAERIATIKRGARGVRTSYCYFA